jgi:thymidylate kinase
VTTTSLLDPQRIGVRSPRPKDRFAFSLAEAAEKKGLGVVVWRDEASYPSLSGFDLDLVAPGRAHAPFERLLRAECGRQGWDLLMRVRRGTTTTFLLAASWAAPLSDDGFLQVDLHTSLTARGAPFASLRRILRRSFVREGIRWMDPVDAAATSWLEAVLSGAEPKAAYRAAFDRALATRAAETRRLLEDAVGDQASALVLENHGKLLNTRSLRRSAIARAIQLRPAETARVILSKSIRAATSFLMSPGRMWILSGPDGAGKSAVLEALKPLVERRLALSVDGFHTRPYLVPRLAEVLPMADNKRADILRERRYEPRLGVTRSVVRMALLLCDYTAGYWTRVKPLLAKGHLVVFDRYAHDYQVDPQIRGIDLPDWMVRFLLTLVPRGHRRILVQARPETLAARKPDLDVAEAARQLERYRQVFAGDAEGSSLDTDGESAAESGRRLAMLLLDDLRRGAGGGRG